jgi:hypothetical protein
MKNQPTMQRDNNTSCGTGPHFLRTVYLVVSYDNQVTRKAYFNPDPLSIFINIRDQDRNKLP